MLTCAVDETTQEWGRKFVGVSEEKETKKNEVGDAERKVGSHASRLALF